MIAPDLSTPIYRLVADHTYGQLVDVGYMVSAIRHVHTNDIPGAIVECGVWQGGMLKAAQMCLEQEGIDREIWGYDTFAGMTEPGPKDEGGTEQLGRLAVDIMTVRHYLGYGSKLVKGDVRHAETWLFAPAQVSVLRLDVDWYDNTMACLQTLYPRLSPGGLLFVDDYNFWPGCKRAVDEYLGADASLLVRTGTGSGMVKP